MDWKFLQAMPPNVHDKLCYISALSRSDINIFFLERQEKEMLMKRIRNGWYVLLALLLLLVSCGKVPEEVKSMPESGAAAETQKRNTAAKGSQEGKEKTELTVFAAASMTETLNELKTLYETAHPEVVLTFNFDSSGTLKTQIQEGAECDLFISAGQKQMNQLDRNADSKVNPEGLDFIEENSRINLLENKVCLVTAADHTPEIKNFDALSVALKSGSIMLAMGNADVPVGQYTSKILAYYKLPEEELAKKGCLTYGSNVKEVTTQVAEGAAEYGVVYETDAYSSGLKILDTASREMCGQIIYPAAVLKTTAHFREAQEFLTYLRSEEASRVFEKVGFTPVQEKV